VGDVRQPDCLRGRARRDVPADLGGATGRRGRFDFVGAALATGGMLLLVYALVNAPTVGWGQTRTIAELAGAAALLAAFVVNELRVHNPVAPLSIFKVNGLGSADATMLIAFAGFLGISSS